MNEEDGLDMSSEQRLMSLIASMSQGQVPSLAAGILWRTYQDCIAGLASCDRRSRKKLLAALEGTIRCLPYNMNLCRYIMTVDFRDGIVPGRGSLGLLVVFLATLEVGQILLTRRNGQPFISLQETFPVDAGQGRDLTDVAQAIITYIGE